MGGRSIAVLAGAVAVLALQGWAIGRQSLTSDEAYHAVAGYQADRYGQNGLNLEHPPLFKMAAALPLLAERRPLAPVSRVSVALDTAQAVFTDPAAERRVRLLGRALLAALFGLPLLGVAFLLGRELGGAAAGVVLALLLGLDFSVVPLLSLLYSDAAAALGCGLALLGAARFLRRPGFASAAFMGLGLGLAAAAKYTGLLVLPSAAAALLLAPGLRAAWGRRLLCGALMLAIAWGGVELTYAIANRHYDRDYGRETIQLYFANRSTIRVEDRLQPYAPFLLAVERLDPRAAQFLTGLLATRAQNALATYPACNFGRMHSHGLWWYFPLLLLAKTPLPLLAVSALALAAACARTLRARSSAADRTARLPLASEAPLIPGALSNSAAADPLASGALASTARDAARLGSAGPDPQLIRRAGLDPRLLRRAGQNPRFGFTLLLALAAGVYLAAAIGSNYNAGLRHLLPILPLLYLPAALWLARRPWIAALLLAALLAESIALAPIWLSSTNTWWLGSRDPLRFALSTDNCYYHQNLIALRDEAERRIISTAAKFGGVIGTAAKSGGLIGTAAKSGGLRLHLLDPSIGAAQAEAYLGKGAKLAPTSPLVPGWYAVGTAAEVCLPAIQQAAPGAMYGQARYQAIASSWMPLTRAVAARGEDLGYVAGTFHLYRLSAAEGAGAR
ncbi:MAG TPA: hypothetical protein VHR45_25730 [Thermoanaerobaculia bacterium]|nr:hypothetical protein [Thermoanaerobaculia bacterium]